VCGDLPEDQDRDDAVCRGPLNAVVVNPHRLEDWEVDKIADAAQMYVDAFTDDDKLTMVEAMKLTIVKDVLEKLGRKQVWDDDGG